MTPKRRKYYGRSRKPGCSDGNKSSDEEMRQKSFFKKGRSCEGEGPEGDSSILTPCHLKPTLQPSHHITHSLSFVSNTPSVPLSLCSSYPPPGPDGHQLDWFRHQTITHSHTFSHTYCHTLIKQHPQPHTDSYGHTLLTRVLMACFGEK